jgi:hypothetical protein
MDPITIGLAFTAAQQAVGYIKQAIALGKDANSLIGQMGKFFEAADTVHIASIKAKHNSMGKSDAQLGRQALEFAMRSNQLREDEAALKNMIYWELGKPQIWEEMVKERARLLREKREGEAAIEKAKQAHKEKMAQYGMLGIYFIAAGFIATVIVMLGLKFYSMAEEKREYEIKQLKYEQIRKRQQQQREAEADVAARTGG